MARKQPASGDDNPPRGFTPSQKAFLLGELIGEEVKVVWSSKGRQALGGKVVDETRNTFVVATPNKEVVVAKAGSVFYFPRAGVRMDGRMLLMRPEDRTRKLSKRI